MFDVRCSMFDVRDSISFWTIEFFEFRKSIEIFLGALSFTKFKKKFHKVLNRKFCKRYSFEKLFCYMVLLRELLLKIANIVI